MDLVFVWHVSMCGSKDLFNLTPIHVLDFEVKVTDLELQNSPQNIAIQLLEAYIIRTL